MIPWTGVALFIAGLSLGLAAGFVSAWFLVPLFAISAVLLIEIFQELRR